MYISKKFVTLFFLLVFIVTTASECYPPDSETEDNDRVNDQQQIYADVQPIHVYDWSLERSLINQLYDIRNQPISTYTVFMSFGSPFYVCPSIGYPIPYSNSLTNPLQATGYQNQTTIAQAEPNGIFPSENTAATWVFCVDTNGDITPVYVEDNVVTFPFAVRIVDGEISPVDVNQQSSVSVSTDRDGQARIDETP